MKKYATLISLMTALALGTASAAGGTSAGTAIENTAYASYTDDTGTSVTDQASNKVTTTVQTVASFSITPNDGGAIGTPNQDSPGQTWSGGAKPGDTVNFRYTVTNSGNTPLVVDLTTTDRTDTDVTAVKYYLDNPNGGAGNVGVLDAGDTLLTDTNATGTIDTGVIANNAAGTASVTVFQVYTIPAAATPNQKYGANPNGKAYYDSTPDAVTPANNAYTEATGLATDDNNFNQTVIYTPSAVVGPSTFPAGGASGTYTDANNTTITRSGDTQTASPAAGTKTVTFVNTLKNNGTLTDGFEIIKPTIAGATVTITPNTTGVTLTDTDNDGNPEVNNVASNGVFSFNVTITYTGTPPAGAVSSTIGIESLGDSDTTVEDTTTNVINFPGVAFGDPDTTVNGGKASTVATGNPNPVQPGSVVYFPMEVGNTGGAPDTFNLSGTVGVKLTDGSTQTVNVAYYLDANGNGTFEAGTDTPLVDTNTDTDALVDTGSIPAGQEVKLIAAVTIPTNAQYGTYTLTNQQASSTITGASQQDVNDTLTVGKTGNMTFTKSFSKTDSTVTTNNAAPNANVTYYITGKNNSNANVKNFTVKDATPSNTTFVSVLGEVFSANGTKLTTAKVLYSTDNGTTWSATAPTNLTGNVLVGYSSDGDNTISVTDIITPGQQVVVTFVVKVN
ncbi:beta strand repeat-containing protein [Deinococcus maricopensis]|uniref:Conserved repeat domain protein n=1 Tax=Deinococcus maricopensis (strain DSM 21211 / LMG 22137 / NRRL B-23946 / LB-34) TaxID=709986 RepID=E8U6B7_DEIML|nr:hypothetical protein [Deinococcus maricopensis]ADV66606.1 conserved repeat domain protein [Deinococcus maricopensis DSM 21211]